MSVITRLSSTGRVPDEIRRAAAQQQRLFERHLAPWLGRFFADMRLAKAAEFYRHVGMIGSLFIDIERQAFALPA